MTRCKSFNMVVHLWVWKKERGEKTGEQIEINYLRMHVYSEYIWICIVIADGLAAVSGGAHHDLTTRSAYLDEHEFAYHWHIHTNVLMCPSQADKRSICLKSWRDKKNRNCLMCSSPSFLFRFFHGSQTWTIRTVGSCGTQVYCLKVSRGVLKTDE